MRVSSNRDNTMVMGNTIIVDSWNTTVCGILTSVMVTGKNITIMATFITKDFGKITSAMVTERDTVTIIN
jgi:hypothetical protein